MNLFFYANINFEDESIGITNKVYSQIKAWENLGYKVYYTGYTSKGIEIRRKSEVLFSQNFSNIEKKFNRFCRRKKLIIGAINFLKESKIDFDISYLRFHYFDNKYVKLLKMLKQNNSYVVVEAHGYPYKNYSFNNFFMFPSYLIDSIYEKKASRNIDLVAAISNVKNIWGVQTVFIDNCIDISKCGFKSNFKISDSPTMISASNERNYHGYSKVLKGLKNYKENGGERNYKILFIGKYTKKTKELAREYKLLDSVFFLGSKSGTELKEMYQSSDLGIGSFGIHGGSDHGSSIKSKEYFAYGIPFINGWKEYSFDDSYPYVLRFDIYQDAINFFEIDQFIDRLNNSSVDYRYEMRDFAQKNFDWENNFNKIIERRRTNY